jgi:hypothetical protein
VRRINFHGAKDRDKVAAFLLGALAPTAARRSRAAPEEPGEPILIRAHGASASVRLGSTLSARLRELTFDVKLDGVPLTLNVTFDPRHSLLSPWELAARRDQTRTPSGTLDDRAVYRPLRRKAPKWFADKGLEERGLHLFWSVPPSAPDESSRLGYLALTCLKQWAGDPSGAWHRVYSLPVDDPRTGQVGQIDLDFRMPFEGDADAAFRTFAGLTPSLDELAGTLRYHGLAHLPWGVRAALTGAGAAAAGAAVHLIQPEWSPWGPVLGALAGLLVGVLAWRPWPDPPAWLAGEPFRSASGWRIDVPYGWAPLRGLTGWLLRMKYEAETVLAPRGGMYPQLAIHVRGTPMRTVKDVENLYTGVVRELGGVVLDLGPTTVDGRPAYFIRYRMRVREGFGGKMEFYKVGVIRNELYYLFQCSSDNLAEDLPTIKQCIQTFAF